MYAEYTELFSLAHGKNIGDKIKSKPTIIIIAKNWKILPENLMMTDHFKRQEQADPKQEVEMCC